MEKPENYRLTPSAVNDLEDIYAYSIEQWGLARTERYIRSLEKTFRMLAGNELSGQDYSLVKAGLRAFPHGSHVIFYRLRKFRIDIIRVLHQAMDPTRHF